MAEAEKVSELHLEVKASLMNEDFEKIKNWQKEAFHKQMMGGFKETKEAEDGFRKAQKPWAKKLKEVTLPQALPPAGPSPPCRLCSWLGACAWSSPAALPTLRNSCPVSIRNQGPPSGHTPSGSLQWDPYGPILVRTLGSGAVMELKTQSRSH